MARDVVSLPGGLSVPAEWIADSEREERRLWIDEIVERGGPGSGHAGHKGRPGEVGGSLPGWAGKKAVEIDGLTVVTGKFALNETRWAVVGDQGEMASRWSETPEKAVEDFRATSQMREEHAAERRETESIRVSLVSHFQSTGEVNKEFLRQLESREKLRENQAVGFLREEFGLRWTDANKIVKKTPAAGLTSGGIKLVDLERIVRDALTEFPPVFEVKGVFRRITIRNPGGEGSGHHGHEGRPGKVGGSKPGKGGGAGAATETAQAPGQPDTTPESGLAIPTRIEFDETLPNEARSEGLYDRIVIGPKFLELPDDDVRQYVLAHEIGHTISDAMLEDGSAWRMLDEGAFIGEFDGREVDGINGAHTPGENLAEAYAAFTTAPEWLKEHYPAAYEGIKGAVDRYGFPSSLNDAFANFEGQLEEFKIAKPPEPKPVSTHDVPSDAGEPVGSQDVLSLHEGQNFYKDQEGAHEWGLENADQTYPQEQYHALIGYKGNTYKGVNQFLRGTIQETPGGSLQRAAIFLQEQVDLIDSAMENSTVPEDIITYRGMNISRIMEEGEDIVGKTFKDEGYVSTSLSALDAHDFASGKSYGVLARIFVPSGTNGIYLDGQQFRDELDRDFEVGVEEELLLDRGYTYRVVRFDPGGREGAVPELDLVIERE